MASDRKHSSKKLWLCVGVAVLIVLLIVWLTFAFLAGDTDVAASVTLARFIETFRP